MLLNNGDLALIQGASGNQLTFTDFDLVFNDTNVSIAAVALAGIAGPTGTLDTSADANGYNADFSSALNVATGVVIGNPLYVARVGTNSSSGDVADGQPVQISLNMSGAVSVTGGTPNLVLNDGASATYNAGESNPGAGILTLRSPRRGPDCFACNPGYSELPRARTTRSTQHHLRPAKSALKRGNASQHRFPWRDPGIGP